MSVNQMNRILKSTYENTTIFGDTDECCLIDVHSHMLPNIDDGSTSPDESISMIRASAEQGVQLIAFTPHFDAAEDDPEHFFKKRSQAMQALRNCYNDPFPILVCGAEVRYFEGMKGMSELPLMRIGRSKLLLIEMPFQKWTGRMIDDIIELGNRGEYQVVLAHIERYLSYISKSVIDEVISGGVMLQSNANFFLEQFNRKKAFQLLKNGRIQFIASDSHNMTTRPPRLGQAYRAIRSRLGDEPVDGLIALNRRCFEKDIEIETIKGIQSKTELVFEPAQNKVKI